MPTKTQRSARAFLRQVADELPMHLPPDLRDLSSEQWGRFYKVWSADKRLHFETQFVSGGRLEIGFHMEADPETNERVAATLQRKATWIKKSLGEDAKAGSHGPKWRCLAETWSGGDLRSAEAATEAAARLAEYIRTILPLLPA